MDSFVKSLQSANVNVLIQGWASLKFLTGYTTKSVIIRHNSSMLDSFYGLHVEMDPKLMLPKLMLCTP